MRIEIIGVPLDLGADRRGVDMGPSAIRIAGISERLRRLDYEVLDSGDIPIVTPEVQIIEDPKLKYLPEIAKSATQLSNYVFNVFQDGNFPMVLGGDHSVAIGTIAGAARFFKQKNQKLGLIWIDAHGDMNTPETTPSGNIHGMPFAVSLGNGVKELTDVGGPFPKVAPENAVLMGARQLDRKEQNIIKQSGITVFTMEDIDRRGICEVAGEALYLATKNSDALHISLDMDALDPQVAPGVGTPVRGGLTYRESHTAMEIIASENSLCSFEIVEVNPILDVRNTTAEVAAELAASLFGKRIL
jgi:arginase